MGKEDPTKRFIEKNNSIKDEKIILLKIVSNIVKSGMNVIGVDTPEKM
jgi:Arginyl-tRNA synthetase